MRARQDPRRSRLSAIRRRRAARALAFAVLVAAGAFLATAYSARANDATIGGLGADEATVPTDATTEETVSTTTAPEEVPTEPAPPAESEPSPTVEEPPAPPPAGTVTDPPEASPPPAPPHPVSEPAPVVHPKKHKNRAPELQEGAHAIIWLHRALPDPTPAAKRLAPRFARALRAMSRSSNVDWWLLLAVVRERGGDGRMPARRPGLERLADRLVHLGARKHPLKAITRLTADAERHLQIVALARYNRAVGLRALVRGLEWAKPRLERRILRDDRIDIYSGGRYDIAAHRVDIRVLVLIRYLRVTFRQVTVASLFSGHRYFARPGVVSAHMYGLAVDISALGGISIIGNQLPGGLTARAVERILLLPAEVQPQQVISLLGLGGPSFPLADHYDHIHVGY